MNSVFDACVHLLMQLAALTGLTYEQVNVVIFVLLLPAGLAGLVARTLWLERRLADRGEARRLTLPALQVVFWGAILMMAMAFL